MAYERIGNRCCDANVQQKVKQAPNRQLGLGLIFNPQEDPHECTKRNYQFLLYNLELEIIWSAIPNL